MMETRHLKYFLAVAEELHFGRAAERLHIGQPGLSQQIQDLENELGVRLLERTSRRVALTYAGKTLVEEGRRAMAQLKQAEALTRLAGNGEVGLLRIALTESANHAVLPDLLRNFRQRFPRVELLIHRMTSQAQIEALRTGELDAGILRTPINLDGLATRVILRDRLGLLLPKKHALAARKTISLGALRDEPLLLYPAAPRPSWADFVMNICVQAGFKPHVAYEANDSATAISFVAAGLGVAMVPESLSGLVRPGVIYRRVAGHGHTTGLVLVHRRQNVPETVSALSRLVEELWPAT
jgi:DNA-binding transcriptional LysR family regulator